MLEMFFRTFIPLTDTISAEIAAVALKGVLKKNRLYGGQLNGHRFMLEGHLGHLGHTKMFSFADSVFPQSPKTHF